MGEEVLLAAGGNLLSNLGSSILGNELGKENSEKLWRERYSPQAQVRNLAAAGINPAVAMGNQSPVLSSGGEISPVPVSPFGIGTTGLAELGSYLNAAANAKKAGVDTRSAEEDIKLKQIEQSRNQFELQLRQKYGLKQAAQDLALAESNVRLAQLSGDNAEIDKSIKEYTKAKEKALSECQEKQRDILQKELDNKDTELKLSNRVLKTQGDSNIASANASNTQAAVNREIARYQRVVADVEESASPFKLENLLRHYASSNMISDADYQEAYRRYERLKSINADNDKHEWNKALDAFMFYLEEHVKGLSPFVSAATK